MRSGQRAHGRLDHRRVLDGRRSQHRVAHARVEQRRAVVQRTHAAARLDLDLHRRGDAGDGGPVVLACADIRAAREGGVQIDDVNARDAGGGEARRHLPGGAIVDLHAFAPPLLQAHGGAVHEIDGGENQHGGA
jgi:hypothetical protein